MKRSVRENPPVKMMSKKIAFILISLFVASSASAVPMLDHRLDRGGVGLKLGILNVSTMFFESDSSTLTADDFNWKVGFSGGLFFDFRLGRGHNLTLAIDLHDMQMMKDREKLFDMNFGYKLTFYNRQGRIAYRPGFTAGFGYISDIGQVDKVNLMTTKLFMEMIFLSHPKYSYMLEFSIGMLPTGKSRHYDVHSNPYLMLRGGIVI